jgi:tetratricopeptide (TPR) repeat protein
MRLWGVLGLLLVAASAQAAPPANPNREKARALYSSATTHYNLSEYADALKDFKEAYRLISDPVLLFNIAQCHRQLREFEDAARFYRAYRRENPDASNREEVDRLIAQMDVAVAEKRTQQPPTGTLPAHAEPSPAPIVAPPPSTTAATLTAAPPEKPRPIYKKGWFWGVVVGAAAIVATGVALGVVYGTPKGDSTPQLADVRY